MFSSDKVLKSLRSLLPRGKAFSFADNSIGNMLNKAYSKSIGKLYSDSYSIFDSIIPDTSNFTSDDALMWEKKLGIKASELTTLEIRKKAIIQKYNYPNSDAPRQHFSFIEKQLRDAGFNVRIYENNESGVTRTPESILASIGVPFHGDSYHSDDIFHASMISGLGASTHHEETTHSEDITHNTGIFSLIANHIDERLDWDFPIWNNMRSTFFISGEVIEDFITIPEDRRNEFRQLVLQLKPAQSIGIILEIRS